MSKKKMCKEGLSINKKVGTLKYLCKKCGNEADKEKFCCKPVRIYKFSEKIQLEKVAVRGSR